MIKFKIDVIERMKNNGYSTYTIQKYNLLSNHTLHVNVKEGKNVTMETLNKLCIMCELPIEEIIEYVPDEEELIKYKSVQRS